MIRPEFRKLLMDQRGAAVILWSFFMISIVIYIVIAQNVLANPKYARGLCLCGNRENSALVSRIGRSWLLLFLEEALSRAAGDSRTTLRRQNFLEPCKNPKGPSKSAPQRSYPLS